MTKEELEKEAEEWVISNTEIYDDKFGLECEEEPRAKEAYIAGAEPREKRIEELEKKNAELKLKIKHLTEHLEPQVMTSLFEQVEEEVEIEKENAELKEKLNFSTQYYRGEKAREQLTKAKEIILKLYNAGRDVLMCRAEEKAYDNLSEAISDRSIE